MDRIQIEEKEEGAYAFVILHDENKNGKADTNWIGLPKEGVAVSNNAKGSFGPPDYEDAKFKPGREEVIQHIKMNYLW